MGKDEGRAGRRVFHREERGVASTLEIAWDGLTVEIVATRAGEAPRVKKAVLGSMTERDAMLEKEVRKAGFAGYVESRAEEPPEPDGDDPDDPVELAVERLAPRVRRVAYLPRLTAGDDAPGVSKLGGTPDLAPGEAWPSCGRCGEAMHFMLQLRRDELPAEHRAALRDDLLQLFFCDRECQSEGGSEPFAESSLVRHAPLGQLPPRSTRARPGRPSRDFAIFPARRITGWSMQPDWPDREDIPEDALDTGGATGWEETDLVSDVSFRFAETHEAVFGDKLGGWPRWEQSPERPACRCGAVMDPFFQLVSNSSVPVQYGDMGTGWIVLCAACPEATFLWQCG